MLSAPDLPRVLLSARVTVLRFTAVSGIKGRSEEEIKRSSVSALMRSSGISSCFLRNRFIWMESSKSCITKQTANMFRRVSGEISIASCDAFKLFEKSV